MGGDRRCATEHRTGNDNGGSSRRRGCGRQHPKSGALANRQHTANGGATELDPNPYDFVAISGNVSSGDRTANGGDQNTTGRGVGYAINGQRTSGTEVLLDGAENLDLFTATTGQQVPLDSVQEYRVVTNNFDAQYGRASG